MDERLRGLERRYKESGTREDRAIYLRALMRVIPDLAEAYENYTRLHETVANANIDSSDTRHEMYARRLRREDGGLLDTWAKAGQDFDGLLKQYEVPELCHNGYGHEHKHGPASFRLDPYQSDINNDAWAYDWMCDDCVYESAQDIQ